MKQKEKLIGIVDLSMLLAWLLECCPQSNPLESNCEVVDEESGDGSRRSKRASTGYLDHNTAMFQLAKVLVDLKIIL